MKKSTKLLISLILIVSILICSLLSVEAGNGIFNPNMLTRVQAGIFRPNLNNNATRYFSALINFFGDNQANSCIQIALASYLMFFDYVHNDNFVDNAMQYYRSVTYGNPGNLFEGQYLDDYVGANAWKNYEQFVEDYRTTSLHCYLIDLSVRLEFYGNNSRSSASGYAIFFEDGIRLLSSYIASRFDDEYTPTINSMIIGQNCTEDNLLDTMADLISQGIPVLYFGYEDSFSTLNAPRFSGGVGHCMIAYDCSDVVDPQTSSFTVHTGWHNNLTTDVNSRMRISDSGYDHPYAIAWITVENVPHSCSNLFNTCSLCSPYEW